MTVEFSIPWFLFEPYRKVTSLASILAKYISDKLKNGELTVQVLYCCFLLLISLQSSYFLLSSRYFIYKNLTEISAVFVFIK